MTQQQTEDALRTLIAELEAMDESATPGSTTPPMPPPPLAPPASTPKRAKTRNRGIAVPPQIWQPVTSTDDVPFVSWANRELLFTVRDPDSRGDLLVKLLVYDRNRITDKCALFLDTKTREHGPAVRALRQLKQHLRTLWMEPSRENYRSGVSQTVTALPKWRVLEKDDSAIGFPAIAAAAPAAAKAKRKRGGEPAAAAPH